MIDAEKVLKALEYHKEKATCSGCPYAEEVKTAKNICPIYDDAIAMLQEQEPVKPTKKQIFPSIFEWICGACSFPFLSDRYMYCPSCGRQVKWDD